MPRTLSRDTSLRLVSHTLGARSTQSDNSPFAVHPTDSISPSNLTAKASISSYSRIPSSEGDIDEDSHVEINRGIRPGNKVWDSGIETDCGSRVLRYCMMALRSLNRC